MLMTIGFFLIMMFYLNLMSTDLVVVSKPTTINNYRDITDKNLTVIFYAISNNITQFESAKKGTIQEEF